MLTRGLSPAPVLWKTLAGAILLIIGCCGPLAAQGTQESQPGARSATLARVFAAWRAREERVKSFHITWECRLSFPRGYVSPNSGPLVGGLRAPAIEMAESDTYAFPASSYWCEGKDRIREEYVEVACNGPKDWKQQARVRATVEGRLHSRLVIPAAADQSPWITIWRHVPDRYRTNWGMSGMDPRRDPRNVDLAPLCLAFRALTATPTWSPDSCHVVGENALIDGIPCIKIQMDLIPQSEMCWVDPSRDYIVVRWERRQGSQPPMTMSIEYRQDKQHGWIPRRWERPLPGLEGPEGNVEFVVRQCAINERFPDNTFAASYPKGTRVCDASVDGLIPADHDLGHAVARPPASMEMIVAAWRKRQEQIKSLKFTVRGEQFSDIAPSTKARTETVAIDGGMFAWAQNNDPEPPSNVRASNERERRRNRLKNRDEFEGRITYLTVSEERVAYDGAVTRSLRSIIAPRVEATAYIKRGFDPHDAQRGTLRPILLAFRPFDPNLGHLHLAEFRVSPQRGRIGDVSCVIIETTEAAEAPPTSFWLDPARDYLILREHRTMQDQDCQRMDISYRNDPTYGWIPIAWTESFVGREGTFPVSATAKVTASAINQPIPSSEFQIEFPKGARVTDLRNEPREKEREKRRAETIPRTVAARKQNPPPAKACYDPFADAEADVEAALKIAQESHKRVMIEFGANWCPGCRYLSVALKENPEVSVDLKKSFVLVLVDTESETGKRIHEKYVPKRQRNSIPHLAVLDPTGTVLRNDDTTALEVDDDFSVAKLRAFLANWATPK